jgi:protocatechuate 3,4-dioxygenase beta subunit
MMKIRASRHPEHGRTGHPSTAGPEHGDGMADDLPRLLAMQAPTVPDGRAHGLLERRRALALMGGAGVVLLAGCAAKVTDTAAGGSTATTAATTATTAKAGSSSTSTSGSGSSATSGATTSGDNTKIPQETAGPYPGDGSNGPDVLEQNGVVRNDITSSFGSASGVAKGVPLDIRFQIVEAGTGAVMANAAVYAWHCTMDGAYSMYTGSAKNENFLRGVAATDANGVVTFKSIFPGAYSGRWPHIHFEVYASTADAVKAANKLATSQIALPADICNQVYATSGYEASVSNMKKTSLTRDMVFGDDGAVRQLATMSGAIDDNLTATLRVPV